MTVSIARSNVARTQRAIADLQKKDADEARKEANESSKLLRAQEAAGKASSSSLISQKLREAERAQKALVAITSKRANISQQISQKTSELHRYQQQLEQAEKREADKAHKAAQKAQDDLARRQRSIEAKVSTQMKSARQSEHIAQALTSHDVFISHASEDKDSFVRGFAESLRDAGLNVWYDEFSLGWGDSLRASIDKGLASSRFGVVILSAAFFEKDWPQQELNGLFALELGGDARILPIWHKITKDEVRAKSPMLADKLAMNTSIMDMAEIVEKLVKLCDEAKTG